MTIIRSRRLGICLMAGSTLLGGSCAAHHGAPTPVTSSVPAPTTTGVSVAASTTTTALRPPVLDLSASPTVVRFQDPSNGWGVATACTSNFDSSAPEPCVFRAMATSNGGRTWQSRGPEQRFTYAKASHYDEANVGAVIADARTGWLTGGHPENTSDGGLTWSAIAVPAQLQQVHPVSGGAWAFAGQCPTFDCVPALYREIGTSWSPSSGVPPGLQARSQISAVSLSTAYVFSANPGPSSQTVLVRTSDGGQHWQQVSAPCGTGWDELTALDAERLWLLCSDQPDTGEQPGVLYRSTDGGQRWRLVAANNNPGGPPGRQSLGNFPYTGHDGDFVALSNGFLYISREKFGFVARSEDGGTNWTVLLADDGGGGYTIQILNPGVAWAYNNGCLWRTVNGGSHWSLISTHPNYGCGHPLPQGAQ